MTVETATYVADLQGTLPSSSDPRSQGDDHIRLIKTVLQNTFPSASRARPVERIQSKSADWSVQGADDQTTFLIDTSGGQVNMTLPSLTANDAGWEIAFYKTSTGSAPVFVVPPSGSIISGGTALAKARRAIPGVKVAVIWTGASFTVSRVVGLPVGSMIDYDNSVLPAGYEWPNGQTLGGTGGSLYPEYFAAKGALTTLDLRGRVAVTIDNLGGANANRLAGGYINGTTIGASGGGDSASLSLAQLPTGITSVNASFVVNVTSSLVVIATGSVLNLQSAVGGGAVQGIPISQAVNGQLASSGTVGASAVVSTSNNTGGQAHANLQPSIMCSKILLVE